jgi:hypothetical protein
VFCVVGISIHLIIARSGELCKMVLQFCEKSVRVRVNGRM